MDNSNVRSFTHKVLKKLKDQVLTPDGVLTIFTSTGFKCPFDDKPTNGERAALYHHANVRCVFSQSATIRASHNALRMYMDGADVDLFLTGKNADKHATGKAATKAKKLDEEIGKDGGQEGVEDPDGCSLLTDSHKDTPGDDNEAGGSGSEVIVISDDE